VTEITPLIVGSAPYLSNQVTTLNHKRSKGFKMFSDGHLDMLKRCKSVGLLALREFASVPLRALGRAQRGKALEKLSASMISDVELPDGSSLRFMTPTPLLQARASSALSKEPDTIQWIDRFESSDVLWDVGANVGVFSLYAAQRRGMRVLAFEPSAANYMVLCKNVEMNSLEERIVPYCIALAGTTKLGVLNSPSRELGAALHQFGEISRYCNGAASTSSQGMVGFTIDDFIFKFRPSFPTHLKLDVDGLEWQILQGARQTLCDPRLQSIMAELSVSDEVARDRTIAWLSDAGLGLVSRGEIQTAGSEAAANHFFARMRESS
jgi:FkbM family methyltransferase